MLHCTIHNIWQRPVAAKHYILNHYLRLPSTTYRTVEARLWLCASVHLLLFPPVPPPTCSSTNLFIRPPVPQPTCSSAHLFHLPPVPQPTCSSAHLFLLPPVLPITCSSSKLFLCPPVPPLTRSLTHPFSLPPLPPPTCSCDEEPTTAGAVLPRRSDSSLPQPRSSRPPHAAVPLPVPVASFPDSTVHP